MLISMAVLSEVLIHFSQDLALPLLFVAGMTCYFYSVFETVFLLDTKILSKYVAVDLLPSKKK